MILFYLIPPIPKGGDLVVDLSQTWIIVIMWALTLLIVFMAGYMACDHHWKVRNHGPLPKQPAYKKPPSAPSGGGNKPGGVF